MWNIEFFHTLDLRRRRALPERTLELYQRGVPALHDHLDGSIAQVAGETTESQTGRLSPHPPAEPHALNPAMDEETEGGQARLPLAPLRHPPTVPPDVDRRDEGQ